MLSISPKGYIKAKASSGKKLEGEAGVESDRFVVVDYTLFFSNHLLNGEDIQVVVGTADGNYQFNFTITSDSFDEIHKLVEEKEASES